MIDTLIGLAVIAGYFVGAAFTARAIYPEAEREDWGASVGLWPGTIAVFGGIAWPLAGLLIGLLKFAKAPARKAEAVRQDAIRDLNERINIWHDLVQGLPQNSAERIEAYKHVQELRAQRDAL